MISYDDFELLIDKVEDGYIAKVKSSPAGEAENRFAIPFNNDRLQLLIVTLGIPRSGRRTIHSSEMDSARELGSGLFRSIFAGSVLDAYRKSVEKTNEKPNSGLRIKLFLQNVPELNDIPWEYLLDPDLERFIGQSNQTPIVRYLEIPEKIKPLKINLPLEILLVISSPSNYERYEKLDVDSEINKLKKALEPLINEHKVNVTSLSMPTVNSFQRCLRKSNYHVLHFIGHGMFEKQTEEGVLVFLNESGEGVEVNARQLGMLIHDHRTFRLAVLNACEGARNSTRDPFASVASTIVRQGIPAVVAMQFKITDNAAITFSYEFYSALADGLPIDTAVAEARKGIYAGNNDIEWGTPVLYMRSMDGVLFTLDIPSSAKTTHIEISTGEDKRAINSDDTGHETNKKDNIHGTEFPVIFKQPGLRSVIVTNKSGKIVTGSADGIISLRTIQEGNLIQTFDTAKEIKSLSISSDDETLAIATNQRGIYLLKIFENHFDNLTELYSGTRGYATSMSFSPQGDRLLTGFSESNREKSLVVWGILNRKTILWPEGSPQSVNSVAYSPDGKLFACVSSQAALQIWQSVNGNLWRTIKMSDNSAIDLSFSKDCKQVICLNSATIRSWSVDSGKLIWEIKASYARRLAISPSGDFLVLGCGSPIFETTKASKRIPNRIELWKITSRSLERKIEGFNSLISFLHVTSDGILVTATIDGTIQLNKL